MMQNTASVSEHGARSVGLGESVLRDDPAISEVSCSTAVRRWGYAEGKATCKRSPFAHIITQICTLFQIANQFRPHQSILIVAEGVNR